MAWLTADLTIKRGSFEGCDEIYRSFNVHIEMNDKLVFMVICMCDRKT